MFAVITVKSDCHLSENSGKTQLISSKVHAEYNLSRNVIKNLVIEKFDIKYFFL